MLINWFKFKCYGSVFGKSILNLISEYWYQQVKSYIIIEYFLINEIFYVDSINDEIDGKVTWSDITNKGLMPIVRALEAMEQL